MKLKDVEEGKRVRWNGLTGTVRYHSNRHGPDPWVAMTLDQMSKGVTLEDSFGLHVSPPRPILDIWFGEYEVDIIDVEEPAKENSVAP